MPKKHWCDKSGWEIADAICAIIEKKMKDCLRVVSFISVTIDEVATVDNQSWLCCHAYIVQKWRRVPILLGLVRIVDGCGAENLTAVILELLLHKGGLTEEDMGQKLICFGANGHPSF